MQAVSSLFLLLSKDRCLLLPSALDDSHAHTAGKDANRAAAIVQYELRAKSCWGRRLLPQLSVLPPYAMEKVTEELVPEEHEAGGECSLHQAGGQALEEAQDAFLL